MQSSHQFDLNLIRTFFEVYRTGSFTKAGNNLGISQPSVSAAVRKMEVDIGYQLFVKQGRGISPTANAHKLAARCQQGFSEIINAIADNVSFDVHVNEALLHQVINLAHTQIQETPAEQVEVIERLRDQSLDLAISVFTIKDPSLIIEPVLKEKAVVVCRADHPSIGQTLTSEEFYQHQHVILSTKWERLSGFEYGAKAAVQERKLYSTVGSLSAKLMLVSKSDAIAVVSEGFARYWQHNLGLKTVACPIELNAIRYSFAYHKRYANNEQHKSLRDSIKQRIAE
ncbi:LysR family transcriptional regulator [Photobacterium alginatilyticum]|uniref:LysR family transcriptional regulator n=1 Tax=Photobacterium alginatilyticum TaxID=1775171 RepID=UPI004069608A